MNRFTKLVILDITLLISILLINGLVTVSISPNNIYIAIMIYIASCLVSSILCLIISVIHDKIIYNKHCYLFSLVSNVIKENIFKYSMIYSTMVRSRVNCGELDVMCENFMFAFVLTCVFPVIFMDIFSNIIYEHIKNRRIQCLLNNNKLKIKTKYLV